jgi:hypothetical protein
MRSIPFSLSKSSDELEATMARQASLDLVALLSEPYLALNALQVRLVHITYRYIG